MNRDLDSRRVIVFVSFAFAIAWLAELAIYLTGGLVNSPVVVPGTPITLALVVTIGLVMWAPTFAHLLTRWVTREGWRDLMLRPRLRRGWPYWLAAWFLPPLLAIAGAALYFALFPSLFDAQLGALRGMIQASAPPGSNLASLNPWMVAAAQILQGMLIAPLINGVATFGEEFGWRGYLQGKLLPIGPRRSVVVLGLIWGVWHWPIILMGHNYGLDYPGAPFLGPLAMVWFTVVLSVFLGWVTIKGRSVWPAVIGHAAINGMAGVGFIFLAGQPNMLLGPSAAGLIGSAGLTVAAVIILLHPRGLTAPEPTREIMDSQTAQDGP